jgi:hypothetical protein
MKYPRVLIITPESLLTASGTGLTLASLFEGWPPERMANLYYCGEPPPQSVCMYGWQIHTGRLNVRHFVARVAAKVAREMLRGLGNDIVPGLDASDGHGLWRVRWGVMFQALGGLATPRLDHHTLAKIAEFKPDVVYSILWGFAGMKVAEQVACRTGACVVPHFMDDWPATAYNEAILSALWRRILLRRLNRIMQRAPFGLAICQDMADEFKHRYGMDFYPFMRCVDDQGELPLQSSKPNSPMRLIYTGGLYLGRAPVLALVATAVDRLSATGQTCVLTAHSPIGQSQSQEKFICVLGTSANVRCGDILPPEDVDATLRRADVAVHVESFDLRAAAYTRLSVSTKFPSYLAAGLPILAVGPADISSIRYVERHGIGITVTRPDPAEIAASIQKLRDKNVWNIFANRSRRVYQEQHYAPEVRRRFASMIEQAIKSKTACGV